MSASVFDSVTDVTATASGVIGPSGLSPPPPPQETTDNADKASNDLKNSLFITVFL